jgi:hypothetical protein
MAMVDLRVSSEGRTTRGVHHIFHGVALVVPGMVHTPLCVRCRLCLLTVPLGQ